MSELAIELQNVGKMYKLYRRPIDKVLDAFGINRWLVWRKDYYQGFWALRHLDLQIPQGERLGIIGRNGAGKSTLLKVITGNIVPTEGIVQVNGRMQALLELGTGFHPEFTGLQNIRASLAYQGLSPTQIHEKEEDIIDFAELEEFIDQPVKTYSAGMYARLAFSTATVIEPEVLIIDEVLGAGDAYFAGKCVERMKKLTEDAGATVLFVSHDLGSMQRLCNRVMWLDRGCIVQQGDPLGVMKAYTAMVRKEEALRLRARDLKVLKQQAVLLDRHEDIYDKLLFHFVSANGMAPQECARVFRLRLLVAEEEIGAINVGSPMDNSPEHLHYVMDTPRYMDWGPPQHGNAGTYREYGDFKGKYQHAPFEFAVPKALGAQVRQRGLRLEVEAEVVGDKIALEVYNRHTYVHLGCLPAGTRRVTIFQVPVDVLGSVTHDELCALDALPTPDVRTVAVTPSMPPTAQEVISEYGSGEAKITAVRMFDALDQESRVFEIGQPLKVVFEFEAYQILHNPVFVLCVYLTDGQCFTQWVATSEQLGQPEVRGKGQVIFTVENLVMGKASYIASAAIFKYLMHDSHEAESYHVLDRCIHFQIIQGDVDVIERGLCLQPFEVSLEDGQ